MPRHPVDRTGLILRELLVGDLRNRLSSLQAPDGLGFEAGIDIDIYIYIYILALFICFYLYLYLQNYELRK